MNKIQEFLDKNERSQPWLAKKIGKSVNTVNSWCNQQTQPKLKDLHSISDVFGISILELIDNNRPERGEFTLKEKE